ncbi:domain found in IF2B/IF5-domain-containing protein [Suillus lakei]|nr:domain found in IF2B/IF5-domain-containing protein [Suillus lakei]
MAIAGIVNIRRDVDDKFYRYRMPLLLTKIDGNGNGIKTVVPNMADVARALSRPPMYPTKFFGCVLCARTSFDEKNEQYIVVNDAHDASRLQELLDIFIDKYNPEKDLLILKNGCNEDVIKDCKACGKGTGVDHKLVTFILKNLPKNPKKTKKGVKGETNGNGDGDWSVGTSPGAVKAYVKASESQVGGLSFMPAGGLGDDEGSDDDVNNHRVEENKGEASFGAVQNYQKVQKFGVEKKYKTVLVLIQVLFTAEAAKEIDAYKALLRMVTSEKHQQALLGGIKCLVGLTCPELIPSVSKILMALYLINILEADIMTQ